MKNALLLLLFILALSSCTIEKRRYFKGYHVARSTGSGTARSTGSGTAHSTGSGTAHSTGSGTAHSTGSGTAHSTGSGTAHSTGSGTGEVGKRESVLEEQCAISEPNKPQRGDIVIAGDSVITSPEHITTTNSPWPIQNTASVMGHKKSHALEGLGAIFLLGIITLAVVIGLVIFLFSDSAIAGLIGGLLVGLLVAVGIYLLLIFLFVALLLFIIKAFGA